MRNGEVTDPSAPRVEPVVYIDLDIAPFGPVPDEQLITQAAEITAVDRYPGMKTRLLILHGSGGGNPVYRIEGTLHQLTSWLVNQYGAGTTGESLEFYLDMVCLAR